jgi:hypothetical protein
MVSPSHNSTDDRPGIDKLPGLRHVQLASHEHDPRPTLASRKRSLASYRPQKTRCQNERDLIIMGHSRSGRRGTGWWMHSPAPPGTRQVPSQLPKQWRQCVVIDIHASADQQPGPSPVGP